MEERVDQAHLDHVVRLFLESKGIGKYTKAYCIGLLNTREQEEFERRITEAGECAAGQ